MKTKTQSANKNHESGNRATLAALVNLRHLYATGLRFAKGGTVDFAAEDLDTYREEYKQALKDHVHACRLVHEARRELLATGYEVPDHWLTVGAVPSFHNEERRDGASFTFGSLDHQRLAAVCQEIYLAMLRIDSQAVERPDEPPTEGKRVSAAELNVHARAYLAEHGKGRKVTVGEVQQALGCGYGTVSKLEAWRAYQDRWNKLHPPKTKKAVGFTDGLEATVGNRDEDLARLVAESEADNRQDPSPLSDSPRRVRHHKTV
jgi:hypothetical protein